MRILVGGITLVLLAGCMAPGMNKTRIDGPLKVFESKKTEKDVAQCIQYEWQNQSLFGVTPDASLQPAKGGGYTVYTVGSEYFADVHQSASVTSVKYYAFLNNWIARARLDALRTCL